QLRLALLDQSPERLARLVGRLPHGGAVGRLELGHPTQELRQLRLAPQVAHAQLLQGLERARCGDIRFALRAQLCDPLDHAALTLDDTGASGWRVTSYSATVAAIAAFSAWEATGPRATRSQAARAPGGRPPRPAPTSSVSPRARAPVPSPARSGRSASALSAIRSPGSRRTSSTRASVTAKIAPMLA